MNNSRTSDQLTPRVKGSVAALLLVGVRGLNNLLMPLGAVWLLLTVVCICLAFRRDPLFVPVALAWLCCTIAGNGWVADRMIRSIEKNYLDVDPLDVSPLEKVAVLGGTTGVAANGQLQVGSGGDRIVLAVRMYHLGLARNLVCTGSPISQGPATARLLMDMGVPKNSIILIGGQNTLEEMKELAELLGRDGENVDQEDGRQDLGIITSAWHMDRAMRLAAAAGICAVPLPANFTSSRPRPLSVARIIGRCIPNYTDLATNTRVLREHLARLVGR